MASSPVTELCSWKEIASYLGVSVKTAQLWERDRGLPIHRFPGDRRVQVRAHIPELEQWKVGSRSAAALAAKPTRARWKYWVPASVFALVVLIYFVFSGSVLATLSLGIPLTSDPGLEEGPDLSPDGQSVAFLTNYPGKPGLSLVHQFVTNGRAQVLASDLLEGFPRWSPDGASIAFPRAAAEGTDLVALRLRDRTERILTHFSGSAHRQNILDSLLFSWSPDGLSILISDRQTSVDPLTIVKVNLSSGERRILTKPSPQLPGDTQPVLSQNGKRLAFVRQQTHSEADIYVQSIDGSDLRRVTYDAAKVDGVVWVDNDRLIFSSSRLAGRTRLWLVGAAGGPPMRLSGDDGNANYPSLRQTHEGSRLVYQFQIWDTNLWKLTLGAAKTLPSRVAASTWPDFNPSPSPANDFLAFVSKRSGSWELWVSSEDGTRKLTNFNGAYVDSPRWSPDGHTIVFTAQQNGNRDVYFVPASGGEVRRFTTESSEEGRPSFSQDGTSIYFRSNRSGKPQIWKQPLAGGEAVLATQGEGYEAFESPDGSRLYFVPSRQLSGLWMVPVGGGRATMVAPDVQESRWWMAKHAIYFIVRRTIKRLDLVTHVVTEIADLPGDQPLHTGFSVNRDGDTAYWTQIDQHSADVMIATLQLK